MGEPIIIWPPNCGDFAAGDSDACYQIDLFPCSQSAQYYDSEFGGTNGDPSGYEDAVASGNVLCCGN